MSKKISKLNRNIQYREAIGEAHVESLKRDKNVFIMGPGIADITGIFGTTKPAADKFAPKRVFDTPTSENTLTGMAIGAAAVGMRPVLVHARNDFVFLTLDQIINQGAKWSYMSGGAYKVPFLVRAIIGRGWGQGAQHSQSIQSILMHIPGLQVIMPVTPYDAKGMILSAMESDKPTICLEHRWLYEKSGPVPKGYYTVPIGKGRVARKGKDVTIVAVSQMVMEAEKVADELQKEGISVEVIDLRTVRPLDTKIILDSVKKTKRLVVCDTSWKTSGLSAEILALVSENLHGVLLAPPIRMGNADTPTPCTPALEKLFYPSANTIGNAVRGLMGFKTKSKKTHKPGHKQFTGPF